jgi:hypothetical protein
LRSFEAREKLDGMKSKLPALPMPFNFAGRLYLIRRFAHKISARVDEPFRCGLCGNDYGAQERYSTLTAEAEDGTQVSFISCLRCVKEAIEEFPDMEKPAIARALTAKIEHDGATPANRAVGLGAVADSRAASS